MLNRLTISQEFVVSVADVKPGRALAAGRNQPLVPEPAQKERMVRPSIGENKKRRH